MLFDWLNSLCGDDCESHGDCSKHCCKHIGHQLHDLNNKLDTLLATIQSNQEETLKRMTDIDQAFTDLDAAIAADDAQEQDLMAQVTDLKQQVQDLTTVSDAEKQQLLDAADKIEAAANKINPPVPAPEPTPTPEPTPAPEPPPVV